MGYFNHHNGMPKEGMGSSRFEHSTEKTFYKDNLLILMTHVGWNLM